MRVSVNSEVMKKDVCVCVFCGSLLCGTERGGTWTSVVSLSPPTYVANDNGEHRNGRQ